MKCNFSLPRVGEELGRQTFSHTAGGKYKLIDTFWMGIWQYEAQWPGRCLRTIACSTSKGNRLLAKLGNNLVKQFKKTGLVVGHV